MPLGENAAIYNPAIKNRFNFRYCCILQLIELLSTDTGTISICPVLKKHTQATFSPLKLATKEMKS